MTLSRCFLYLVFSPAYCLGANLVYSSFHNSFYSVVCDDSLAWTTYFKPCHNISVKDDSFDSAFQSEKFFVLQQNFLFNLLLCFRIIKVLHGPHSFKLEFTGLMLCSRICWYNPLWGIHFILRYKYSPLSESIVPSMIVQTGPEDVMFLILQTIKIHINV